MRDAQSTESNFTMGIGTPIYTGTIAICGKINILFLLLLAPEILDRKEYTEKVDVFSYSVLLYYLFTGQKPYDDFKHFWDIAAFVTSGKRLIICPCQHSLLSIRVSNKF